MSSDGFHPCQLLRHQALPKGVQALLFTALPHILHRGLPSFGLGNDGHIVAPMTLTWATPSIMEIRCEIMVSAYSSTTERGRVGELRERVRMGDRKSTRPELQ